MVKLITLLIILFSFSAEAATWHVRPYDSTKPNGNGTMSAWAPAVGQAGCWNGHLNIIWNSVSPGDTIYYIGTFDDSPEPPILWITVEKSGTENAWITIRGDHPDGAGIIQCRSGPGLYGIWWGPPRDGSYIEWIGLEIRNMRISCVPQELGGTAHDYRFTNCKFVGSPYWPYGETYNVIFKNCEWDGVNYSIPNAVYVADSYGKSHDFTFDGCYFHEIGSPGAKVDGHVIGWQTASGLTVRNCYFKNFGSGIVSWISANGNESKNFDIRWNKFEGANANYCWSTGGYSIVFQSDNSYIEGKSGNITVAYNIIKNSFGTGTSEGVGIFSSRKESSVYIYNNVVDDCTISYKFSQPQGLFQGYFKNNLSLNPRNYHIHSVQSAGLPIWEEDYNAFYPVSEKKFYYYKPGGLSAGILSFESYKATTLADDPRKINNQHSLAIYPKINRNYTLQSGSPLIDAGTTISGYEDALHPTAAWPQSANSGPVRKAQQNSFGTGWEIGAFVFDPQIAAPSVIAPMGLKVLTIN